MTEPNKETREPGQIIAGDPFGGVKQPVTDPSPEPRVVKQFHKRADTDAAVTSAHHTLGIGHNQASGGDHVHDGITSKKLMNGISIAGAKGGNVALGNLLTALASSLGFTDNTTA